MAFEPIAHHILPASRRINITPQVLSGVVCVRIREMLAHTYPDFAEAWDAVTYRDGVVTFETKGHAAYTAFFMRREEILRNLKALPLPAEASLRDLKVRNRD